MKASKEVTVKQSLLPRFLMNWRDYPYNGMKIKRKLYRKKSCEIFLSTHGQGSPQALNLATSDSKSFGEMVGKLY